MMDVLRDVKLRYMEKFGKDGMKRNEVDFFTTGLVRALDLERQGGCLSVSP